MEIYCYQNVDTLFGIFNAIAAMLGTDGYVQSIAAVVVMGFVMAFLAYAFAPQKLIGWQWLASVVLVYSVLLMPKVDVVLLDKTGGSGPKVVANVPFGAAFFGSLTSSIGNTLTEVFETAFQSVGAGSLPAELSYQQNGLMFGARMVKYGRTSVFLTPSFRTDLINLVANCTQYDLVPGGTIDPDVFAKSKDLWALMSEPNPGRFTTVISGVAAPTLMNCKQAYDHLDALKLAEVGKIRAKLARTAFPQLDPVAGLAVIDAALVTAHQYNKIADAAVTADQLIMNNAMINVVNDSSSIVGQMANDPSSLLLSMGRAQAIAQTNSSWTNFGKVAEEALPLIRNSIEGICYALFPLMIMMLFLTWGLGTVRALKSYLLTLAWIQLWPPVYAILNYMASSATALREGAAASIGAGMSAVSLETASPIYSGAISAEAVVGYLVLSVPAIAWAALKGMETIGQAALTGTSSLQSTISHASGAAALGSPMGMGNVSHQQQHLGPQRTSAMFRSWQDDVSGDTHSRNSASGLTAWSQLQNKLIGGAALGGSVRNGIAERASKGIEAATGARTVAERNINANLADMISHANVRDLGTEDSKRWDKGTGAAFRNGIEKYQQAAKDAGLTQEQQSAIAGMVTAEAHVGAAISPKMFAKGIAKILGSKDGLSPAQVKELERVKASSLVGIGGQPPKKETLVEDLAGRLAEGLYQASQAIGVEVGGKLSGQEQAQDRVSTGAKSGDSASTGDRSAQGVSHERAYKRAEAFAERLSGGESDRSGRTAELRRSIGMARSAEASLRESQSLAQEVTHGRFASSEATYNLLNDPRNTAVAQQLWQEAGGDASAFVALASSWLASQSLMSRPTRYLDGSAVPGSSNEIKAQHEAEQQGVKLENVSNPDSKGTVKRTYGTLAGQVGQTVPTVRGTVKTDVDRNVDEADSQVGNGTAITTARATDMQGKAQAATGLKPGDTHPGNTTESVIGNAAGEAGRAALEPIKRAQHWIADQVGSGAGEKK